MVPEEWEEQSLDKVFKLASGSTKPSDVVSEHRDETPHPVYGGNGVLGYSAQANHPGDVILIGRVGEYCGVTRRVTKPCWIPDNELYTKDFFPEHDIGFITYRLQHFDVSRLRSKGGQPLVSQKPIYLTKFALPPLPEQRKIAEVLSTWDRAIEVAEAQLVNARKQKRALMQSLLTGKRRFPEFEGREWREVRLGDLGNTFTGLTGKTKDDFGSGLPYIPYLNIFQNSRIDTSQFDYVSIGHNERQNCVQFGDIFFTTSSETPDEVGMASVLLDEIPDLFLNSFCFGFRLHDFDTLRPRFARFFLRGQNFRRALHHLAQGATRYNLSKTHLLNLKLVLPPVEEQEGIAGVLEAAQAEETDIAAQIGKLRTEKKALMQQLLTGKRRVTV